MRTVAQCEAVTDRDLPAAMGWLDVVPIAGDTGLIESTAVSILERWRKAARKRLPELLGSAKSRLDEFGRMAYINQPDIKEARGGLRDSVLVSALASSWLADRPHGTYDDAVRRLLDVRRLHPSGRRQRYEHAAIALPSQSRGDARSGRSDAARWRT